MTATKQRHQTQLSLRISNEQTENPYQALHGLKHKKGCPKPRWDSLNSFTTAISKAYVNRH